MFQPVTEGTGSVLSSIDSGGVLFLRRKGARMKSHRGDGSGTPVDFLLIDIATSKFIPRSGLIQALESGEGKAGNVS